jgi:RNA polymerase sigma-70 factor (ECF subfamily)
MTEPDATLVQRALADDAGAFDELVRRHRPGLVRCIALIIGDEDEAESLAQETLTRAYTNLTDFNNDLPLGPWLRGIALNLCRNHLRARKRHAKPVAPEQLLQAPMREGRRHGVLSSILRREQEDQALLAIGQLPALFREAFVLHFIEALDYRQMSRITGVAEGTLRVRAHRARALLRENLGSVVDTWLRETDGP